MGIRTHVADAANVTAVHAEAAALQGLLGDETPSASQVLVLTDHGNDERFVIVGDAPQIAALARGVNDQTAPSGEVTLSDAQWQHLTELYDYTDYTPHRPDDVIRILADAVNALDVTGRDSLACPALGDIGIWDTSGDGTLSLIIIVRLSPDLRLATHPIKMWEFHAGGTGEDAARFVLEKLLGHRDRLLRNLAATTGQPTATTSRAHRDNSPQLDYRFADADACRAVNMRARFLTGAGFDERPCLAVGGVWVSAYLDAETGAVRVSIDIEDALPDLVRPDGTLPLRVDVMGALVFDDSNRARIRGEVVDQTRR